ncbi:PREDICTED: neural cell adhesion molecule L1-like protein [Condylura cristata]|uniref:neural cell adhesion molecule L1-like protein n=1 Tax=Condylura cristata TaxID=143302 RepID=UPI0006430626|nr:PREDICTED: neural cell adhesion molecule L1-like protein [Condylura cristata]
MALRGCRAPGLRLNLPPRRGDAETSRCRADAETEPARGLQPPQGPGGPAVPQSWGAQGQHPLGWRPGLPKDPPCGWTFSAPERAVSSVEARSSCTVLHGDWGPNGGESGCARQVLRSRSGATVPAWPDCHGGADGAGRPGSKDPQVISSDSGRRSERREVRAGSVPAGGPQWTRPGARLPPPALTARFSVPQVPTITRQSGEQVALPFDEHFLMECEATGNPQPQFSWTKDGKPFDLSDPRIVVSSGSGTFTIPNDGHVAAFQGKYRCFAANRLGVAMSEEISFVVPNIPKFPKENIEPLEVEEGDPVVLPCSPPRGLPPLHIYWMNIGESGLAPAGGCTQGRLSCSAAANSIKQRKPRLLLPPAESGPETSVTVLKGHTLLLECFAEGLPTPRVEWRKTGADLPQGREAQGSFGSSLRIEAVTGRDGGTYRCTASNALGAATHDFRVAVEDMPPLIQTADEERYAAVVGRGATLHCQFFASPQAVVTWQKVEAARALAGSHYVVHENGSLHIPSASADDAGAYSCWVENALGKTAVTASLDVRSECRVSRARCSPRPRWILIDGATLTLSNITLQDQGAYSCSAHTALDSAVDVTQVTVTGRCRQSPGSCCLAQSSLAVTVPSEVQASCSCPQARPQPHAVRSSGLAWWVDHVGQCKGPVLVLPAGSPGPPTPTRLQSCGPGVGAAASAERGGLDGAFATQGWFIGLLCAGALLTLALLTVCFVRRNKGGKYSVKEKEDQHPDPEGQSGKEETFGDYR